MNLKAKLNPGKNLKGSFLLTELVGFTFLLGLDSGCRRDGLDGLFRSHSKLFEGFDSANQVALTEHKSIHGKFL